MTRTLCKLFAKDRSANVALISAIGAPILVGSAGFAVETGVWYHKQRHQQMASDIAVYAAAIALRDEGTPLAAESAADMEAGTLGYSASVVTVNSPPVLSGNTDPRAVEVVIQRTIDRTFSGVFSKEPVSITTSAVATYQDAAEACLLSLDISAPEAMKFSGSADISLLACEVMSNSIAADAVDFSGSADLEAPCVNSVGGVVYSGSADMILTECQEPRTDLSRAADPYADRVPPSVNQSCSGVSKQGSTVNGSGSAIVTSNGDGSYTVTPASAQPVRFCGGLSINDSLHFEPGVYIVDGGDFRVNSTANVYGDGVTFYLTDGAEARFNGSAHIDINAPTTGNYAGIAIWGDRNDTSSSHIFNGNASSLITGAIYTPGSHLEFAGNFSGESDCLQLVGATVNLSGTTDIQVDCEGTGIEWATVPGIVRLVE